MRRSLILATVATSALLALAAGPARAAGTIDPDQLAGLAARPIGPAVMSGRLPALDVVESDPDVMYAGGAAGGVWKSVNGGLSWKPVFDDQPVASIGAIAINQANPDIVWVGTGEGNPRNSVSIGNGIYRSLDGGKTWSHLGLEATEHIHRIVLHPTESGHRLGRRARPGLGREPRARRVQDGGRRQDLAQGALRRSAHRRRPTW